MRDSGCLVSSMAMVISHYKRDLLTPKDIATSTNLFAYNLLYKGTWSLNGVTTSRVSKGSSINLIDSEINLGRPVIVGLNFDDNLEPDHFIVIKNKIDGEYIMHDPFIENGHDIKLIDKYPLESIARVDYVTVN